MEIVNFINCADHYEARKKEQEYFKMLNATLTRIEPVPLQKIVSTLNQSHNIIDNAPINKIEEKYEAIEAIKLCQKLCHKFCCKICDYYTSKKSSMINHEMTARHKKSIISNKIMPKLCSGLVCDFCEKTYKDYSGLWRHKKKCTSQKEDLHQNIILDASLNQIEHLTNLVIDVVKQNQELQKQMLELASKPSSITNNTLNNTLNNNNSFNLNVFLNETCKDAMNLTDFVNSLTLTLKDLEDTGKLGYEEGISQIFINGLKELDVSKRPIHCTDVKREKLYIRDSNIWEKDQEQEHLRKAVRKVANKNVDQIIDWIKANPESQNYDSKKNDQYLQIVIKSTGGSTKEEEEKRIGKVITNIARHVEIDKNI